VVEDENDIAGLIKHTLERSGDASVEVVGRGDEALRSITGRPPDLVILDLNLPVLSGDEVCRILRQKQETRQIPIIMLTARTSESDRVAGLDLGADDYVTKPFSLRELAARVRAVLRRLPGSSDGPPLRLGKLMVDPARHEVSWSGRKVELTPREFRLLETLARAPGRAFSRAELIERAFGADSEALDRTIDAHVANLRRKLEEGEGTPAPIETVFGVGYRLRADRA